MKVDAVRIEQGDCIAVMDRMIAAGEQVDAAVIDPPYHLTSIVQRFGSENAAPAKSNGATGVYKRASAGFMGEKWDGGTIAFEAATWRRVYELLKPGGYLLAFNATRNFGKMQVAIEAAGFEVRDTILDMIAAEEPVVRFLQSLSEEQADAFLHCVDESQFGGLLAWVFGTGYPKNKSMAKMLDKLHGVKGTYGAPKSAAHAGWIDRGALRGGNGHDGWQRPWMQDEEAVDRAAREYLPASEDGQRWNGWGDQMKPAFEPIVVARKPLDSKSLPENLIRHGVGALNIDGCRVPVADREEYQRHASGDRGHDENRTRDMAAFQMTAGSASAKGRFPANLIHDGSDSVVGQFPGNAGAKSPVDPGTARTHRGIYNPMGDSAGFSPHDARGSASRFFYSTKADVDDRLGSNHPTVKPIELMRYLIRLVTPPGGTVLDCFAGSGTTGVAALLEGMAAILIEKEDRWIADIRRRLDYLRGEGRISALEKARLNDADAIRKAHGQDLPLFSGE